MQELRCKKCGLTLEQRGDKYVCLGCGAEYQAEDARRSAEEMARLLDEQKQERVANLRQQLWKEFNEDYIDDDKLIALAREIRSYLPEDFFATFCELACGRDYAKLNAFLVDLNVKEHADDLEDIVKFMFKILRPRYLLAMNNLLERGAQVLGNDFYNKYYPILARESQKLEEEVYNPLLPRDVFVMYSSADMKMVISLVEELEKEGLRCFVAARNIQHGRKSDYNTILRQAMDSCKVGLFVSTTHSRSHECDALSVEMEYIRREDMERAQYAGDYAKLPRSCKKPRVEYVAEPYCGRAVEKLTKELFAGFERCTAVKDVIAQVYQLLRGNAQEERPAAETKYCISCGAGNPRKTKFCIECGAQEFAATAEERERILRIRQDEALQKATEAQRRAEEAAARAQRELETERRKASKKEKKAARRSEKQRARKGAPAGNTKAYTKSAGNASGGVVSRFGSLLRKCGSTVEGICRRIAMETVLFFTAIAALVFMILGIVGLADPMQLSLLKVAFYVSLALLVLCIIAAVYNGHEEWSPGRMWFFIVAAIALGVLIVWTLCTGRLAYKSLYTDEEDGVVYAERDADYEVYRFLDGCSDATVQGTCNGKMVTSVAKGVAQNNQSLVTLTFTGGDLTIHDKAFKSCSRLSSVTFTDGNYVVENYVFEDCYSLTDITVSSAILTSGMNARYAYSLFGYTDIKLANLRVDNGSVDGFSDSIGTVYVRNDSTVHLSQGYGGDASHYADRLVLEEDFTFEGSSLIMQRDKVLWGYEAEYLAFAAQIYIPVSVTSIPERFFGDAGEGCTVYYAGAREQWENITVAAGNNGNFTNGKVSVICDTPYPAQNI